MINIIKRLLRKHHVDLIEQIRKLEQESIFRDSNNNEHVVYCGLKDIIKPGWEKNFNREFTFALPGRRDIRSRKQSSMNKLNIMLNIMEESNLNINNKSVLEIGCYGGTVSMMMKNRYNTINTCSDIPQYYIIQRGENITGITIDEQSKYLKNMRELYMNAWELNKEDIQFVDDDICSTELMPETYDIIFSFETLEHIKDPKRAFINMAKLLKPGGIMFHHYNPFFSITGGHSFATTNILWGHALLNSNDIKSYFLQHETDLTEQAMSFLENNLNRMTIADLELYTENDFETLYLNKKCFYDYSGIVPDNAERIIKANYNTAEKDDLTHDEIILMMKKD